MKLENHPDKNKMMFNYFVQKNNNYIPKLVTEPGRKRWVPWGDSDKMPSTLFDLYTHSSIHKSIIDSKVNMVSGNGIIQDTNELPYSERTQEFLDAPNYYDNINDLSNKISWDLELYGIGYLEIIYSEDRTSIAQIEHIPSSKIRWGHLVNTRLTSVYYSDDFTKTYSTKEEIKTFNPRLKNLHPRQILPIMRYTPSVDYYTLPSYYSSLKWINIDYEISKFHENNIMNGFVPTILINMPMGVPTQDEMELHDKKFRDIYSGSEGKKFFVSYSEPGSDNKTTVETLSITDADKQYEWLLRATQQQILIGHQVTNENLVGISTPGKLGSSTEYLQAYDIYYNDVILPDQNLIIDAFNKIMRENGLNDVTIVNEKPLTQEFNENTLVEILTTDELREKIGYEPLGENEIIDESENKLNKLSTIDIKDKDEDEV